MLGIEVNEFAAELARVTVWIGELQSRIQRGCGFKLNPVLEPLVHIQCRDAVLEAELAGRMPTDFDNAWQAGLANIHAALASADAWADCIPAMPDDEILRRLLALNLTRTASG